MTREWVNSDVFFVGERHAVPADWTGFLTDLVADAVAWWRDSGAPPPRTAFDISRHPAWASNLFLVRRLSASRFEYRLAGEEVIRIVGINARGWTFDRTAEDPKIAGYAEYLERVATDRLPWRCTGRTERKGVFANPFESVDLPLTDADGEVSAILGLAIRMEPELPAVSPTATGV